MKKRFLGRSMMSAALLLALMASCGGGPSTTVTIGAMPPGTSWYVFAATLSGLLEQALPDDTAVEVVARGGGVGNPILVDRGEETIALAQAATAAWAYNGNPLAYGDETYKNIRALAGGLNSVWMVAMLREDYISQTGNDSLEKALLAEKPCRIVMKPKGSTVPVVADMLFEALGTSREEIIAKGGEIIQVTANQIPALLRDGRADLYLETAIEGHPTMTEAATTVKMRFVEYPQAVIDRLAGPGVSPSAMPDWFPGQTGPVESIDMGTVLIAHKDLSDDMAYLITKTVCESREKLGEAHRAWRDFDPEKAADIRATGVPLHPGAERYYREQGWL